jgi:hypothetical protein
MNPAHHHADTHVTQMIETRDIPDEIAPEVDSRGTMTEMVDRTEM